MEDFLPQDPTWPPRRWYSRTWLPFLVGGMIGLLFSLGNISLPNIPFRVQLQIVIGYFLAVAAHEAGHVMAGLSVGFKITTFALWPLEISRQDGSWRLAWMRSHQVAGFVTSDPGNTRHFRLRMAILVAAGPAASLFVGIGAGQYQDTGFLAAWSTLFALNGLIPMADHRSVNDAARLRMLWRGGAAVERYRRMMLIAASSKSGVRPRDLDPALLEGLEFPEDRSGDARSAQILRFNWLLDSGRVEEAGKELASILSWPMPEQLRATWWLEAAWVEARFRSDAIAARRWYDSVPTRCLAGANRCAAFKAHAAIAFVEQHWDDADAAIEEALKSGDSSDLGIANTTRDDLRRQLKLDVAPTNPNLPIYRNPNV